MYEVNGFCNFGGDNNERASTCSSHTTPGIPRLSFRARARNPGGRAVRRTSFLPPPTHPDSFTLLMTRRLHPGPAEAGATRETDMATLSRNTPERSGAVHVLARSDRHMPRVAPASAGPGCRQRRVPRPRHSTTSIVVHTTERVLSPRHGSQRRDPGRNEKQAGCRGLC
jgi:hypothetical protein